ncbi:MULTISPECIES: hypothetical protein [Pandoraea]|uniref:hypothetical protein n=1 Tax=Pandoraea TaxID=93217 RepID=UPI001F5C29FD|nr:MULTISPECIES: hypothetical protein [Pandoraea]MCI3207311.1 hypothetical protein [Pandoraea sp. LA3]MDN4585340.1 hypothetical protein [Pandoraea capi]
MKVLSPATQFVPTTQPMPLPTNTKIDQTQTGGTVSYGGASLFLCPSQSARRSDFISSENPPSGPGPKPWNKFVARIRAVLAGVKAPSLPRTLDRDTGIASIPGSSYAGRGPAFQKHDNPVASTSPSGAPVEQTFFINHRPFVPSAMSDWRQFDSDKAIDDRYDRAREAIRARQAQIAIGKRPAAEPVAPPAARTSSPSNPMFHARDAANTSPPQSRPALLTPAVKRTTPTDLDIGIPNPELVPPRPQPKPGDGTNKT